MNNYIKYSLKATGLVALTLSLATLINFLLSLVFMTAFADIQLSAIWVLHGLVSLALIIVAADKNSN
jgi:hypothetical protein